MPDEFQLTHTASDGTKDTRVWPISGKWWAGPDVETEDDHLPDVFVQGTARSKTRDEEQPVDDVLGYVESDTNDVLQRVKGKRLYDEWMVTVADTGEKYDVSAESRVKAYMYALKRWVWFTADSELYNHGATNEIPVLTEVVADGPSGDTSEYVDDANSAREVATFRFDYTLKDPENIAIALGFDVLQEPDPLPDSPPPEVERYVA